MHGLQIQVASSASEGSATSRDAGGPCLQLHHYAGDIAVSKSGGMFCGEGNAPAPCNDTPGRGALLLASI